MRKEITIGDYKSVYFKIVDTIDEIEEKVYHNEKIAKEIAKQHKGKVMKITKRMMQTMQFERV